MRATLAALAVLGFLCVASTASAARPPTYVEKVTIMDAFNIPGRAFASSCVKILVSTVDSRWAMLTSPAKPPKVCSQNGQVGDGFVILSRVTKTSLRWLLRFEGSSEAAPCFVPRAVRADLTKNPACL